MNLAALFGGDKKDPSINEKRVTLKDLVEDLEGKSDIEELTEREIGQKLAIIPREDVLRAIFESNFTDEETYQRNKELLSQQAAIRQSVKKSLEEEVRLYELAGKYFTTEVFEGKVILEGVVTKVEPTSATILIDDTLSVEVGYLDLYEKTNITLDL